MKTAWAILFSIGCTLLVVGVVYVTVSPRRGSPVTLLPAPTEEAFVVHVVGEVIKPGIYRLQPRSHVQDAIEKAGGLKPDADSEAINLAAEIKDGQQIVAPARQQAQVSVPTTTVESFSAKAVAVKSSLININTASQVELESLPWIGPALASRIIEYRKAHGPFASIDKLVNVPGIGPSTFQKIKALITVDNNN